MTDNFKSLPKDIQDEVRELVKEVGMCSVIFEFGNHFVVEGKPIFLSSSATCQTFTKEDLITITGNINE